MGIAELIQEQVKDLPEDQVKEVLDFIVFLKTRREREQWDDLMRAQSTSLSGVWDNDEDEVWNDV